MVKVPGTAIVAARRVIEIADDLGRRVSGNEEVLVNRARTRFYHWRGWRYDGRRCSRLARLISEEEAVRLAEEIEREG